MFNERGTKVNGDYPDFSGIFEIIVQGLQTAKRKRLGDGDACNPMVNLKILSIEFNVVKDENLLPPQAMALKAENKVKPQELGELADEISPSSIDRIALTWLGFTSQQIQTKRRSHTLEEQWLVTFDILETWQMKNEGQDERKVCILVFFTC